MLPGNVSVVEQQSFASQADQQSGRDLALEPVLTFQSFHALTFLIALKSRTTRHFCPGDDDHVRGGGSAGKEKYEAVLECVSVCAGSGGWFFLIGAH